MFLEPAFRTTNRVWDNQEHHQNKNGKLNNIVPEPGGKRTGRIIIYIYIYIYIFHMSQVSDFHNGFSTVVSTFSESSVFILFDF